MTVSQLKKALEHYPEHLQVVILRDASPDPGHDLLEVIDTQHIEIPSDYGRSRKETYLRLVVYHDLDSKVL